MNDKKGYGCIYWPPNFEKKTECIPATLGVKFCQDSILLKSFLDSQKISYNECDLEDTIYGKGIRIKKEEVK